MHHRLEVIDFNERTVNPSDLPAMLETLDAWNNYTERFLKDIEASVAESDGNLAARMAKEREIEESVAQNKETCRISENNESNVDGPNNAKRLRSRRRD